MASAEKLTFGARVVGGLLVFVAGLAITYGATAAANAATSEQVDKNTKHIEAIEHEQAEQREWRARVETHLQYQTEALRRWERSR